LLKHLNSIYAQVTLKQKNVTCHHIRLATFIYAPPLVA